MAWNKRVRAHAERSELSFAEIARRAPMTERRMRRLMTGRTLMRASDMEVFARVLGMTIEALYREPGQRRAA